MKRGCAAAGGRDVCRGNFRARKGRLSGATSKLLSDLECTDHGLPKELGARHLMQFRKWCSGGKLRAV